MTNEQWINIKKIVVSGGYNNIRAALIVDSPWVPSYLQISTLDYLTDPEVWFNANKAIVEEFPEIIFIPGFWVEMGMAAEPSGFGCKVNFYEDKPPTIQHLFSTPEEANNISVPNPLHDGLMPIILSYYRKHRKRAEDIGHTIRMTAARGPLALAAHLMGVTDFLIGLKLDPDNTHKLLRIAAETVINWLHAQGEVLKNIEGVLVLDDIIGFLSEEDYLEFAHPYMKMIFDSFPGSIKFLHNDTVNPISYPHMGTLGIDVFNFTHKCSMNEAESMIGKNIVLMGNIPPLEGLALGSPQTVRTLVSETLSQLRSDSKVILSAGGGVSPGTPGENIREFIAALNNHVTEE